MNNYLKPRVRRDIERINYRLIAKATPGDLSEEVNRYLDSGLYRLWGSPLVSQTKSGVPLYCQGVKWDWRTPAGALAVWANIDTVCSELRKLGYTVDLGEYIGPISGKCRTLKISW